MFKIIIQLLVTTLLVSHATPFLKTGQIQSYDENGATVLHGDIEDDGYYQKGTTRYYSRTDNIVTDGVTGLEWQDNESVQRPWLTEQKNTSCVENTESTACNDTTGTTAASYCSELAYASHSDWRLPSIEELKTIIDYGKNSTSINDIFLSKNSASYWSFTTNADFNEAAWSINFDDGYTTFDSKAGDFYVRCVRGAELDTPNLNRENKVVSDTTTNLQWQDDVIVPNLHTLSWIEAIEYCEDLDLDAHEDWRLPNINELNSIVDYSSFNQSIDKSEFSNTKSANYWSSTTHSAYNDSTWNIDFYYGLSDYTSKLAENYVRCVRGGEAGDLESPVVFPLPAIIYLLN